ncbi:biliverdin-producing heme oxygenase [Pseudidiomarina sp.]|uniref:biliverdin-producing heme oxygenase n=1 Tax=Pseudidiomarina sp. TaxID=2081707 RepID=UPI00299D2C71|nr:biliverdin-producing heme oxygenase [Pseudidiomarina sp.]MDX1705465.1 biliverdin-producing heme oxygenase [Pseudidiomarina sp.]
MSDAIILQKLRIHTADLHRQVEASPVMSGLLQADLTAEQYLAALQVLAALIARYEGALLRVFDQQHQYQYIPRLSIVYADIRAIGGAQPAIETEQDTTALYSDWELAGAAYVIEGSTMGGRILARRIENVLGPSLKLTSTCGISYFHFYQRGSWDKFKNWLEQAELSPVQHHEVVKGAQSAFHYLAEELANRQQSGVH